MPPAALLWLVACSDYAYTTKTDPPDAGDNCANEALAPSDVPVDTGCLNPPTIGSFTPVIEWQWQENPDDPGYDDIMATPAVAELTDDDGDGDIDGDDIPDVVFMTFSGGAYTSAGALVAVSGDGSGQLWSELAPGGYDIYSSGAPAIGDLDADGRPDICTAGVTAAVVCVNNDGSFKWAAGDEVSYVGAPALGDMDGDGLAEVIFGRQVFGADGTLRLLGSGSRGFAAMSFPADVDGDGALELVTGNTVEELDGTVDWSAAIVDGIPALGDFDGDGRPELVSVALGIVSLVKDGAVVWQATIPGGGSGGAPTVADFDGDGLPEVGVAGLAYYTVFDTDGTQLWSEPVSDYSSSVTGSSVFDFEADGASEVVYADEHDLWVFDGATGAVKLDESGHASGTLYEYPLVVDVDGDGHTEIVVASNNYTYDGWNGITVIGDANQSWAESRPVWNEFAYHISNVDDDGSIPPAEAPNWATWNNFRAGGTTLGASDWLSDLTILNESTCTYDCTEDTTEVWLEVANTGLAAAEDVLVQVARKDGTVLYEDTEARLDGGTSVVLGPIELGPDDWQGPLTARVDPDDAVGECDETDDFVNLGDWPCK